MYPFVNIVSTIVSTDADIVRIHTAIACSSTMMYMMNILRVKSTYGEPTNESNTSTGESKSQVRKIVDAKSGL